MSVRQERVAEGLKKEISDILRQMKDPRIDMVTVVSVEVSKDIRHAKVYVSTLGGEDQAEEVLKALVGAAGHVRSEVASRTRLRYTPEIEFRLDKSIAHSAHIADLLRQIEEERKEKGEGAGAGGTDEAGGAGEAGGGDVSGGSGGSGGSSGSDEAGAASDGTEPGSGPAGSDDGGGGGVTAP